MDSIDIISAMIIFCVVILIITLFSGAFKFVLRTIIGAIMGAVGIYMVNMMFPAINIGVNLTTLMISGLLGLPGFAIIILSGLIL